MKRYLFILFILISSAVSAQENLYVATTGDDSTGDGSIGNPWETWTYAATQARPGDTVNFRGGTYYSLEKMLIDPNNQSGNGSIGYSGKADSIITYRSYPGEWAILDCINHVDTYGMWTNAYNQAIATYQVEHIHFKDFEVTRVFQLDSVLTGAISSVDCRNLRFENLKVHDIGHRGFYILSGAWQSFYEDQLRVGNPLGIPAPYWSDEVDSTYFTNIDCYDLFDTLSSSPGNGADGYKLDFYRGNYIEVTNCRTYFYSDDGWDCSDINGAGYVFYNNGAMASNKYYDPGLGWVPERSGIKTGAPRKDSLFRKKMFINNFFAYNEGTGLTLDNGSDGEEKFSAHTLVYNNFSYKCGYGFWLIGQDTDSSYTTYRNNIGYGSIREAPGTGYPLNFVSSTARYFESNNNWDRKPTYPGFNLTDTVTVTDADWASLDSLEIVAMFTTARDSDGSLPSEWTLPLAATSDLIDAGTQIFPQDSAGPLLQSIFGYDTLNYNALAPDLGFEEYAVVVPVTSVTITSAGSAITIETNNGTLQLTANILPVNASLQTVTWSIADGTGSATISVTGLVQAVTDGTVTATATANDGSGEYDDFVITNSNQTAETVAITTSALTAAINSITITSGGNVTDDGGAAVTAKGVCYNTAGSPTISDSFTVDGTGEGAYTSTLNNLKGGTRYYIAAYATNSQGTSYGEVRQAVTYQSSRGKAGGKVIKSGGKTVIIR